MARQTLAVAAGLRGVIAVGLLAFAGGHAAAEEATEPPPPSPAEPAPAPSAIPKAPSSPSPADIAKAKAVFGAGGRAFEQGDFAAAIQAFEQAYALSGRSSVLFSLAQAHRKQFVEGGQTYHREAAIELYRAYLAEVKTGGRRADAVQGLEALTAGGATPTEPGPGSSSVAPQRKTQLAIDSSTPGALISIDGGPPAPPQVMVEVAPGRHTVKVTAPGHIEKEFVTQAVDGQITPETYELDEQPAKVQIQKPSGAQVYVDGRDMGETSVLSLPSGAHFISVSLSGHRSIGRVVEVGPGETTNAAFDLESTSQRDASIGFLVAGAVTAVAGSTLLGVAFARQSEAQEIAARREAGSISSQDLDAYEAARTDRDAFRGGGVVVGGAGILAALVGGVLYLFDDPPPVSPPSEGLVPTKTKKDEGPRGPGDDEMEMSGAPWVAPGAYGGVALGGAWSGRF